MSSINNGRSQIEGRKPLLTFLRKGKGHCSFCYVKRNILAIHGDVLKPTLCPKEAGRCPICSSFMSSNEEHLPSEVCPLDPHVNVNRDLDVCNSTQRIIPS